MKKSENIKKEFEEWKLINIQEFGIKKSISRFQKIL